jgi:hypothetical protein
LNREWGAYVDSYCFEVIDLAFKTAGTGLMLNKLPICVSIVLCTVSTTFADERSLL